ncbi:uncharacterized protein [Zea mays]|uniref:uncharacterized protein isoform X4 n=1 Tax=Zea mays TaxID=4577 RepID=UPI0009A9A0F0|nr:uncharacterized protein LOC100382959 isoform X4 [Zea mays]|eukprot:XP_020396225.1 uncharacterized protein LOC100382959 isoform X3 [Zea mays]
MTSPLFCCQSSFGHDSHWCLINVKTLYYKGLSFYTTEEEFKDIFSPFGTVEEARLMRDHQTGRMKGFGFVKYSSQAEAEKAVKAMDGKILRGRLIFVEMAKGHESK